MKALDYFRHRNKPFWKLEKDGKKIHEFQGETFQEAEEELANYLALLEPGRYTIKIKDSKAGEAGQGMLDFVIPAIREQNKFMAPTTQTGGGATLTEMLNAAREQGKREAEIENRLANLEKAVAELTLELKKLTDDDDENDAPALEKISNLASSLPGLMSGLKSLTGK